MKGLKFDKVTFGYNRGETLFEDLSFEISQPEGEGFVTGLMGSSGSGKSTILKLILGIEEKYHGVISIIPSNPVVSYVPQEPILFDHLTPLENAEYFRRISNYKSKFDHELFNEVATALQIQDILESATSINEISGGQRQRISLLRAMSIQPDFLLLDEPMTGLDEEVKDQFLQTLAMLIQRFRLMVIYVTHHRKETEFIADEILFLEKAKNLNSVSLAIQTTSNDFFSYAPTVSALNAIKDISVNTIKFKKNKNGPIIPTDELEIDSNIGLISFSQDVIQFTENSGFEFDVAAKTGAFTLLQLKNSSTVLTIENNKYLDGFQNKFMTLSGKINLYDSKGRFLRSAEIENNEIITE
ncbi:ABC transporter ATP-binding protein [Fulvivirgaceae bacterium BMA10]|uniref:ABC transporter ATP-binding protein n=1 Tax=Splendidivirga corallicola TaxID=3051826 RepID=A0ABT8KXH7_9BACT|nr:ABC transporter ATP-binding protein [Fulvivirgaceae bacterium BMA10]